MEFAITMSFFFCSERWDQNQGYLYMDGVGGLVIRSGKCQGRTDMQFEAGKLKMKLQVSHTLLGYGEVRILLLIIKPFLSS